MLLLGLSTYLNVSNDSSRENTGPEAVRCGAFYGVDTRLLSCLKEGRWGHASSTQNLRGWGAPQETVRT